MSIFEKLATKTAVQYLLTAVGFFIIGRWGITPDQWKDVTEIIVSALPAIVALVAAGKGITEALKNKVVVNGKAVKFAQLSPEARDEVVQAVSNDRPDLGI